MKKSGFIFFLFVLIAPIAQAQKSKHIVNDSIYSAAAVEKQPEYPGGHKEFAKFIAKTFVSPNNGFIGGKILAGFVVETDGSLSDIKILHDAGFGSGEQIRRLLMISQRWIPGEVNCIKVRTNFVLPILLPLPARFSFNNNPEELKSEDRAEVPAGFPGGPVKFYDFIRSNFKIPEIEKGIYVSDDLLVSFLVDAEGEVKDIKIKKDLGYGSGAEAIKVLAMCPRWKPAERGGERIDSTVEIPIHLELSNPIEDLSGIIYESELLQKMPDFPYGNIGLLNFFYSNFEKLKPGKIPYSIESIKGNIVVEFVVNTDGTLQDFKILSEYGRRSGIYAIKVMEGSPNWTPGIKNGKIVRSVCRAVFPVK